METIAFIRLHQFAEGQQEVMDQVAQYCDGIFFLTHKLIDESMYDLAWNHPKCICVKRWEKEKFANLAQLRFCLEWASKIKPKYVLEFDEDEIPPFRFEEVFNKFKLSDKLTMWFKGLWSWNGIYQIAVDPMRRYLAHMKVYKWSEEIAEIDRGGFNGFRGIKFKSPEAFLSKYPLIHAAFASPELIANRMKVGGSKGHMYNDLSWFNQDVKTIPYNKDFSNRDWAINYRLMVH
jgi:hypothetical protein